MHELSLAWEVIELSWKEATKHKVTVIRELEIEIGDLSGVDATAFQSALELIVKGTILSETTILIRRIQATAWCSECCMNFPVSQRLTSCPECGDIPSRVTGGREFRIVSLLAD